MKSKKENIIGLLGIIYLIVIIITAMILRKFDYYLRNWFLILSFFIVHILVDIFVLAKIFRIKANIPKVITVLICSASTIIITCANFLYFNSFRNSDSVKELENKKYLGVDYLSISLSKLTYYYDKYNIFAYNDQSLKIVDVYNKEADEVKYRTYYKDNKKDYTVYLFDENGEEILEEDKDEVNKILDEEESQNQSQNVNNNLNNNIEENLNYYIEGRVIEVDGNKITLEYGNDYLGYYTNPDRPAINSVELPENPIIYDYETENKLETDDISKGDYIYIHNVKEKGLVSVVADKKFVEENAKKELIGKKHINTTLGYMNEKEGLAIAEIGYWEDNQRVFDGGFTVYPKFYLKLNITENSKSYLGMKNEYNQDGNWGWPYYEIVDIYLTEEIDDIYGTYDIDYAEFIAD